MSYVANRGQAPLPTITLDRPEDGAAVNHPAHYQVAPFVVREVLDVIEGFGCNFGRGNVVKYVLRAGEKSDEVEDLRKARWYLDREIARLTRECVEKGK